MEFFMKELALAERGIKQQEALMAVMRKRLQEKEAGLADDDVNFLADKYLEMRDVAKKEQDWMGKSNETVQDW